MLLRCVVRGRRFPFSKALALSLGSELLCCVHTGYAVHSQAQGCHLDTQAPLTACLQGTHILPRPLPGGRRRLHLRRRPASRGIPKVIQIHFKRQTWGGQLMRLPLPRISRPLQDHHMIKRCLLPSAKLQKSWATPT